MDTNKPSLQAIGVNLWALRSILTTALENVDDGLKAVEQGEQNLAVGSILPSRDLPKHARGLIQAIMIIHRQR